MTKYDESNFINKRFGRFLVTGKYGHAAPSIQKYVCVCDCGNERAVAACSLLSGVSKSCGCLHREVITTHGHTVVGPRKVQSPTYQSWIGLVQRCTNPNNSRFAYYGGKGVKVCDRWLHSFDNFIEDMGERPYGKTIDRKNGALLYSKETCRWSTSAEQQRNRCCTLFTVFNGVTVTLKEASDLSGIKYKTLQSRVRRGVTPPGLFKSVI